MIRGKAVEEAIRFAFLKHKDKLSVAAAQSYANDLYYLRTKYFPPSIVKSNAQPINSLVRTGINTFLKLGVRSFKNLYSFQLGKIEQPKFVFPDFVPKQMSLNNKKFNNCCLELKISNKRNYKVVKRHVEQCLKYSTKSRKPVILVYLFYEKKPKKLGIYNAFGKIFIVSEKIFTKKPIV